MGFHVSLGECTTLKKQGLRIRLGARLKQVFAPETPRVKVLHPQDVAQGKVCT